MTNAKPLALRAQPLGTAPNRCVNPRTLISHPGQGAPAEAFDRVLRNRMDSQLPLHRGPYPRRASHVPFACDQRLQMRYDYHPCRTPLLSAVPVENVR